MYRKSENFFVRNPNSSQHWSRMDLQVLFTAVGDQLLVSSTGSTRAVLLSEKFDRYRENSK